MKYLPPNRTDFNPIERVFAKLKATLRKAQARTVDARWVVIGQLLDRSGSAKRERYGSPLRLLRVRVNLL